MDDLTDMLQEEMEQEPPLEIPIEDNVELSLEDNTEPTVEQDVDTTAELPVEPHEEDSLEEPEADHAQDTEPLNDDDIDLDLGEIAESDADPLQSFIPEQGEPIEEKVTIEDIKEPVGGSAKNLKNIAKLGDVLLDRADKVKAQICSSISGQHMAEYSADDELREALIEAIKEYLATQEFKAPTPFGTLMIALAMWSLPPLGMAFWHKYSIQKQEAKKKAKTKPEESSEEIEAEPQTDYSHLREYQQQRKIFTLNKNGAYKTKPSGQFISNDIANEKPSPEVLELIEQGLDNKQIRSLLNYGQ